MQQTPVEKQSRYDRIHFAERLIQQLPKDHDGRNTWLLNYGQSHEARKLRAIKGIRFIEETEAAATYHQCRRCGEKMETGLEPDGCRDLYCPELRAC